MRLLLLTVLFVAVAWCGQLRSRAEPNQWFLDLVLEDQQHDSHDHSGETQRREDHVCFHVLEFGDSLDTPGELMADVHVPYNYWWRAAATLVSVTAELDQPAERLVRLDQNGLALDLVEHGRVHVRLQCAFPCCLELADIVAPERASHLLVAGGNATHSVPARRLDPTDKVPPGYHLFDALQQYRHRHQALWRRRGERDRLAALELCDYDASGLWLSVESGERVEASLAAVHVSFIHHEMLPGWETGLCEEALV